MKLVFVIILISITLANSIQVKNSQQIYKENFSRLAESIIYNPQGI